MRLALNAGYWGAGNTAELQLAMAVEADRLDYDSVWVAEAYGSDCVSVLSWIGARTERIGLGSAVMQIPARTPAMTAMTAATLDTMSGGRFRLGLGVSGPQVSEGWHGVPFGQPLGRTREYIGIVRTALARKTVTSEGPHYPLPLPDGPGKALRMTIGPAHEVPVYVAAVGPANLRLAGEVADGWLGIFFSPEHSGRILDSLREKRTSMEGFDVLTTVPVSVHDDVEAAADAVRPYCALYIGGMGSRDKNFYNQLACRMGFEKEAAQIQDLYLAGKHRDAAAAVPLELIDATALLGPHERIRERAERYREAGVTTLAISPAGTHESPLETVRALGGIVEL